MPKATKTQNRKKTGEFGPLRERLLEQRQEILSMYEHDLREGQMSTDEGAEDLVDRANNAYNREFMLSLSGSERAILFEIEKALERLEDDSYGSCSHCGDKIPKRRLQAVPWARYCIECQEQAEQGLLADT